MSELYKVATLLLLLLTNNQTALAAEDGLVYRAFSGKAYDDVVEDVKFALAENNYRITGGNNIGEIIAGRIDQPFPRSEIIHFCNLEYARKLLERDERLLLKMPCKAVVYETGDKVVVETQLLDESDPASAAIIREVNGILKAIVDYATAE